MFRTLTIAAAFLAGFTHASTLYTNFSASGNYDVNVIQPLGSYEAAQKFTPSATQYLSSLLLAINFSQGANDESIAGIQVFDDLNGRPGNVLETLAYTGHWIHDPGTIRQIDSLVHPQLTLGQTYYIGVYSIHNAVYWNEALAPSAAAIFRDGSGPWIDQTPVPSRGVALDVEGTLVAPPPVLPGPSGITDPGNIAGAPEPGSLLLMGLGLAGIAPRAIGKLRRHGRR
jgi:hypothetical protein